MPALGSQSVRNPSGQTHAGIQPSCQPISLDRDCQVACILGNCATPSFLDRKPNASRADAGCTTSLRLGHIVVHRPLDPQVATQAWKAKTVTGAWYSPALQSGSSADLG